MHLPGPGISRFAIATSAVALALIAVGALSAVPGAGTTAASPLLGLPGHTGLLSGKYHIYLAIATGAMTLLLAIGLAPANVPGWVRALGWVAVSLFGIDSAIMAWTPAPPAATGFALPHAIVAPLFLAAVAVTAYYVHQDWINGPEMADISLSPSLPLIALLTPISVVLQITLGAAYRHKIYGVMPHMAGAMVATLLLLVLSVQLLQNFPEHPTLRPVAIAAMSVLLLQVTLGIGAFVMRLLDFDTNAGFVFIAATHVCVGALTLAVSVVLCIEVRRCCAAVERLTGERVPAGR